MISEKISALISVDLIFLEVNAPVILICGGKDIGKSTFARYLTNILLNRYGYNNYQSFLVGNFSPQYSVRGLWQQINESVELKKSRLQLIQMAYGL